MRKKTLALVAALIVALSLLTVVVAKIYWTRTLTHEFTVIGIEGELLRPTGPDYANKVVATSLVNNKVFVTIYAENFYNIWLNCSWSSDAVGLDVNVEGQYVEILYVSGEFTVANVGSPFDAEGYHTVDKTKMMWKAPGVGVLGCGALQLTYEFDTEGVLTPGDYSVEMLFEMGFV
mgnify:CR=1 FL=1|jgi:hypothetical protein